MRAAAVIVACFALSTYDAPASARGLGAAASASPAGASDSAQGAAGVVSRVTNGRIAAQPAAGNLDATFRRLVAAQTEPGWIGYAVPAVNRNDGRQCCSGDTWISDGIVFTNGRIA